jgi:hypothetical protein
MWFSFVSDAEAWREGARTSCSGFAADHLELGVNNYGELVPGIRVE